MKTCPYCCESISDHARKCKECGEMLSIVGRLFRIVPVISVLIADMSLGIAWTEIQGREAAETREQSALKREQAKSEDLGIQKTAADRALLVLAERLTDQSRIQARSDLNLPPNMTLDRLESQVRREPGNVELQKKTMLFRAIERP